MTRDEAITAINNAVLDALPTNVTLTSSTTAQLFNAALTGMYTVDPSKKPTVKHITDLGFD